MKAILKQADAENLALLQAIDVDELLGIKEQVAKAVKTNLQALVLGGANLEEAIIAVEQSAGQLAKYAKTYINTSRSTLSQKITDLTANHLKEAGGNIYYEYFGSPPDEKTREECLIGQGVNPSSNYPNAPYFTEEEKNQFEGEFGLRWNCRHEFVLITEKYYNEMVGK